ncbi:hypothetical protein [Phaffia rhodozyma]|uniref:Uncharacterized protein n=1 Tax=Phaffia rhodozyma TaxID=264483 RepID=A0A0F7SM89_PHARH|nr:hypothetical protein [Phaffia rhodozyma]
MAAGLWGGSESSLSDGDVGDDDDLGSAVARCKERLRLWRLGCEEGDSSVHRERLDETDTSDDPETDCEQTPSSSTLVFPITITRQSFSGFPISPSPADYHPDGSTPTPSFHLAASTPTPAFHFPLSTSPTSAMAISPSEASPSSRRLMWARSLNKQFSGHLDDEAPATPSVDGERPPLSIFPRANWSSVSDSPPPTPDWDLTRTMTIPEPSPSSQLKESPNKLPRLTRTDSGFFPSAKPITPSLETLSTMMDLPDSFESSLPLSPAEPVRQSYLVPSYPSDSASVSFPTASLDPSRQSTEPLLFSPSLSVSSSLSLSISDDSLSEGHPLIRPSPPDLSTFSWAHALFREKTDSVAVEGDDRVSFDSW